MVVLVRIPRVMAPTHYFEIHEIVHGMNNAVTWQAIAIRFSIAPLVALATTLVLRDQQVLIGLGIGFLSALFLIWPTLLDRRLLPPQAVGRETELYLVYAMFVAAFTLLGVAAGFFASYLEEPLEQAASGSSVQKIASAMGTEIYRFLIAVVAGVAGSLGAGLWKQRDRSLQRGRDEDD